MQLLTGLVIRVLVPGVVNMADVERKIKSHLLIQIRKREIGIKAPVVETVVDQVVDVIITRWHDEGLRE